MAHFYASIQGNRGESTRTGSKNSGIRGHIRGWSLGVKVYGSVDDNGNDTFTVELTSGSNGSKQPVHIGCFKLEDLNR